MQASYGVDDDSVMERLMNELDISSAIDRLMRVGFLLQKEIYPRIYLFTRTSFKGTEALQLVVDINNHFVIKLTGFDNEEHSEIVSTWDEWVDFVRMLIVRWFVIVKNRKAASEDSPRKEP